MHGDRDVELGDLIVFADSPQPGEYGIVIRLETDFAEILWPWGPIECSYSTFIGERWGHLKVVRDECG